MNPFNIKLPDLNFSRGFGLTKESVDDILKNPVLTSAHTCIMCGNTAQYRLIPKKEEYNTAEVQDRGYACTYCLSVNNNIKAMYGIREIEE